MKGKNSFRDKISTELPEVYGHARSKSAFRLLRVGEEIRRCLSEILERGEMRNPDLAQYMVTITDVVVRPDLRNADVFMTSVMATDQEKKDLILGLLMQERAFLRHLLSQKIFLRRLPDLHFKYDQRFSRMEEIDRLLNSEKVKEDLKKD